MIWRNILEKDIKTTFVSYYIIYFMLSQNTLFTTIFFHCFRWRFAIVIITPIQKDQPEQIEELISKVGATSVAWNLLVNEKSDTEQKNVLCKLVPTTDTDTTNLVYHLMKNHVKEYCKGLWMWSKKEPSGARNKPQIQMLEQASPCSMPYNKNSWR